MDDLLNSFDALRISALSKSAIVSQHAGDVTLGPNSNTESIMSQPSITSFQTAQHPPENKTLVTNGISEQGFNKFPTYSVKEKAVAVALKMQEMKRKLEVKKQTKLRYKTFAEFDKELLEQKKKFWDLHQANKEKQIKEEEYLIISTLEEIEATSMAVFKQVQDSIYKQQLASAQLLSMKEEQFANLQALSSKAEEIVKDHKGCIEDIDKVMKQNPEAVDVFHQYTTEVVNACNALESFRKKLNKTTQLTPEVIHEAESQLNHAVALKNKILAEIKASYEQREREAAEKIALLKQKEAELAKEQAEAKQQEELKKLEKLAEAKALADGQAAIVREPSNSHRNINPMYEKLVCFQQQHSLSFKQLLDDASWKQFKFNCKKAVNLPVNAISATNAQHLRDKYDKLSNLLHGRAVVIGDAQVILTQHPQGIAFCKDLLAQKFVLQGDLTISSNPEAAFAYATIIVTLWNEFPDFGSLLLYYFYQACPYLVPLQIQQREGELDEAYYRSLGYQYKDGVIEQQDKFLKRMTGISRLFFAIMITNPRSSQKSHPFNIKNAWSWQARTLNTEPYIDVTATLLFNFLEVAGSTMLAIYRRQFEKCIVYIKMYEIPKLKQKDSSGGPIVRLERMLTEYDKSKKFEHPSGILSPNFW